MPIPVDTSIMQTPRLRFRESKGVGGRQIHPEKPPEELQKAGVEHRPGSKFPRQIQKQDRSCDTELGLMREINCQSFI